MNEVWLTVVGAFVGAFITWFCSWWYYVKAGKELKLEAQQLRKTTELVLYAQLNKDAKLSPRLDEQGRVIGIIVEAVGRA
jgi:hypothetical protein